MDQKKQADLERKNEDKKRKERLQRASLGFGQAVDTSDFSAGWFTELGTEFPTSQEAQHSTFVLFFFFDLCSLPGNPFSIRLKNMDTVGAL